VGDHDGTVRRGSLGDDEGRAGRGGREGKEEKKKHREGEGFAFHEIILLKKQDGLL
jgi:hypothetical protein